MPYIDKVCNTIMSRAEEYSHFCKEIQKHPEIKKNLKPSLFTERTVAHFVDTGIERQTQNEYILISECNIHCTVNKETKEKAKSEILDKNQEIENFDREYYIPDTVLVPKTPNMPMFFIEYKSNKKFQYYQLAIDYLKYKFYSSALKCHSTFIYVMFYEDHASNIGIIPDKDTVYLMRNLKKDASFKGKSIFIFKNISQQPTKVNRNEILTSIAKADRAINEVELLKANHSDILRIRENPFYENYRSFGKDVIIAKVIQDNFSKINQIKAKIINSKISSKLDLSKSTANYNITLEDFSNVNKDIYKYNNVCKEIVKHFNNQINIIFRTKIEAIPKILSVHRRKSIWILILIQKFISDLNINGIELKINLPEDEKKDYYDLLNAYYKSNRQNLHSLCFGLIFYITKLYPIIFKISDNKVVGQKDTFTFVRCQKKINEAINDIRKTLQIKIEIDLFDTESQLNFAKEVLNREP